DEQGYKVLSLAAVEAHHLLEQAFLDPV
ncbi:MAG: hypothetical protein JWR01_2773, partial [Subtercola sp.]|nr:hypothetical protein [Subtercola sp.]